AGITVNSSTPQIRAVRGHEGEVWIAAGSAGLWHSSNGGQSYAKLSNVEEAKIMNFGKAGPDAAFPAIFVYGKIGGITGVFRSDDYGTSWIRINDDMHQIGDLPRSIAGDWNTFGKVYIGTGGRGAVIGQMGTPDIVPTNQNPLAIASVNTPTIYLPTTSVTLTGSGTDADGTVVSYKWNKTNGGVGTITNSGAATTTVTGLDVGQYTFQLTVTDDKGGIGVAEVDVFVYGYPMKIDNKKGRQVKFKTKY
ncbi:MAG TPA: PKD domain-containing protein, partial [Chitinophagaceae bacterium]|nr:PKD domain-containing protein [Chitinophagaceae bacterium]